MFRVCNVQGVGYIHLRNGHAIHACTSELAGDMALRRMVEWIGDSSVDPCESALAPVSTIRDELELFPTRAGTMSDEQNKSFIALVGKAAASPGDQSQAAPLSQFQPESSGPERQPWSLLARDCEVAVGVSVDGEILFSHGNADDLGDVTALVARLAQLTAAALGMEEVMAMECSAQDGTYFIYRSTGGEQIALKPNSGLSLQPIKAALDL